MVGTTLAHYRILEQLGRGGMGEVYRAEDTHLKREVALKVISPEAGADDTARSNFRREAETLAALDHPGIVPVYSIEKASGVVFLTMALVDGETLAQQIAAGDVSRERFFRIAIALADAVASAHEQGIVHRDLKPQNIMVDASGRPRILDFGIARLSPRKKVVTPTEQVTAEQSSGEEAVVGTLPYMSPEQLRGLGVDHRSDIFSLGIVLYELATGTCPFRGVTPASLVSAVLEDTPPLVSEVRPELPRQLGRIIQGCLEKDPDHRCQDARDVRNQLEALDRELETEEILKRSTAEVERAPLGGRRTWGGLAAVLVVTAFVVLYLYGFLGSAGGRGPRIESLAVLPFDNLTNDPDQEYLVQGMHEALITELSKIGSLRVICRASAMRYEHTDKDVREIAEELDVDAVIEGSVLRQDGRVRISTQLIDAQRVQNLWAASYDRDLADVLGVLTEVAGAIGREIEPRVFAVAGSHSESVQAIDPAAQEATLRGRYLINQFTSESIRRSLAYFREAVRLEPDYALPWAWMGAAHLLLGESGQDIAAAREEVRKAMELDPRLSDAHAFQGWIRLWYDWDWEAAAAAFRRALDLNPSHFDARHGYGDYLLATGQPEKSLEQIRQGFRVDPVSAKAHETLTAHLLWSRHYEEAEIAAREALRLFPGRPIFVVRLRDALIELGRHPEAITEWQRLLPRDAAAELRAVYEDGGIERVWEWHAERVLEDARSGEVGPFAPAVALARAGRRDAALTWLERAHRTRSLFGTLLASAGLDPLRYEPRFVEILERMGLPSDPEEDGNGVPASNDRGRT